METLCGGILSQNDVVKQSPFLCFDGIKKKGKGNQDAGKNDQCRSRISIWNADCFHAAVQLRPGSAGSSKSESAFFLSGQLIIDRVSLFLSSRIMFIEEIDLNQFDFN